MKMKVILCVLSVFFAQASFAVNFPARGYCTGDYVRIRIAPHIEARILGRAFKGAELRLIDETRYGGIHWYKIDNPFGDGTAWIAGQYINVYESSQGTQNNYDDYDDDDDYYDDSYSSQSPGSSWNNESYNQRVETRDRCLRCHGSGKVACSRCNGSGKTYEYVSTPNYSGKMSHTMSRVERSCSKCHGSGESECGDCGGRGYTIRYQ